uniref:Matrix-remodelling associated 5a n=1 Tax=Mastacembelus armatus TaxID=205130 RepID=A0A3Q3KI91_9TELE
MDHLTVCALHTLSVLMILVRVDSAPCPRFCSCPQPTELHCTFRSLVAIPADIPKQVERINLGFNSITKITDKSLAGLKKLELLMVHGNEINSVPDEAFRDLTSLQVKHISYNKLRELNRHTLLGLWSLARLHLDHNQLEFIHPDAFQGLTSLRLLQLEGNRLRQLHPATFATFTLLGHFHVSTLRHLYMSDNGLTSLPSEVVAAMPQLENLYLHGNPWTCDCNMKWLYGWDKTSPGVLKCKNDRALPSGQLCPMCSSPRHLEQKELQAVENLTCSQPVISSPHKTPPLEDAESEVMTIDDFKEPFGNISLGLSDEHGNEVALECSIGEPKEIAKISWEQVSQYQLASNISLAVDLECPVDRGKYEQLWRLIAYYSNVPAHLQRGIMLSGKPHPAYEYRQDSEKYTLYYTGVKANIMAQPVWLMPTSAAIQLNRLQSSAKMVKLIMTTDISEMVEAEVARREKRPWVMIESTSITHKVLTAILGSSSQMNCNVRSSGQPVIHWMLPDGSKVGAPYSSPDNRVSVSADGLLVIRSVKHTDTGIYYCVAKVQRDLAVLPFRLTVQESSNPPPGDETSVTLITEFAGNPISLPCMASGSPDAEITWILPSSDTVRFQANSSRASVYSDGTLHIPKTQLLDSGYYKCVAMNQHGVVTLAAKVTIVRQKRLIRPLMKLSARPQSASGVNTLIKVPTEEAEEASGDLDVTPVNRLDALRRRNPGGVPPGRRGGNPSRNMWRRPPVVRKQMGSQVEDRKIMVKGRGRINMSKSKIDPEKWADILAKIRDRNGQNTVTSLPVQHPAERRLTGQKTQHQKTGESSQKEGQGDLTTQHTAVTQTQITTYKHYTQGTHDTYEFKNQHTTEELHTLQTAYSLQPTSNSVFFLPQTTSVPRHAVTVWQGNTNSASRGSTFSLQENQSTNTDADRLQTADQSKASERKEDADRPDAAAGSNNNRGLNLSGTGIIPSVNLNEAVTSREENGKYLGETTAATSSRSYSPPKDTTVVGLQSHATLTTAFLTTTIVPATITTKASGGWLPPPLRQPDSRRRNGGRRNRPNRRKHKLNKPTQFITTTPVNAPLITVRTTTSTELKIEPVEVTTANFNTTVPFTSSQAASSGRLSHKGSPVFRPDKQAATEPSPLAVSSPPPQKTKGSVLSLAKPLSESMSAPQSFPTTSPTTATATTTASHGKMSSQTETASSPELITFTGTPPPPAKPMEEMQRASITGDLVPVTLSDTSSGGFQVATQAGTDAEYTTPTVKGREMLLEETRTHFPLLPSPCASAASLIEHEFKTTPGSTSSVFITTTPSMLFESDLETDLFTTKTPPLPEKHYHSHSPNKTTSSKSEVDQMTKIGVSDDAPITNSSSTTSPTPDPVIPSSKVPYFTPDRQITAIITTAEPAHDPATQLPVDKPASPPLKPTGGWTVDRLTTPAPIITAIQTNPFREEQLPTTRGVSRTLQPPGREFIPRGKPRITKSSSQTFTVKAETDSQLPCEAEGEPMPFLSWTNVASGASIAQNTRVQRYEVHPNGTLIIRNTQPMDEGQYLCTVQNQYGKDKMEVNLVVLSQQPRMLQPQNRGVTVLLGGTVDLDCKVEGHPTPRVTWVLPNRVHVGAAASLGMPSQQRLVVLSNGTLRINKASYRDRGIYKCIGSNAAGVDTVSVNLYVSAPPPAIRQPQFENTTFPEGSDAYIHCAVTGAPQPVIHWTTPHGDQLTASHFTTSRNLMVFPNGTLNIQALGPGDAGRYECSASNAVASSRKIVNLSIRRTSSPTKARITSSSPQRTDVIYGSKLLLNCVAAGEPEPRIIWKTPSKKLVDSQYSFDSRIKVFPNGTLTIHSMTDKDSGDYLCVARNKMGDDYVLLRANVLTKPAKIEQKQWQSSQEVVYGGNLKVDCVASGLPDPKISWALPDGTMVNLIKQKESVGGGRSRRYVVFDNGTLYFNDVGIPEEGDYTCYAENQLGKDEMKVRVKVKVATSPPQIQNKDQKVMKVYYGETVALRCNAKGRPMPVTTWISPVNRVISPALDKYQVLDDGALVVQKVQRFDGGNYTCIVRNSAGQDHKVIRLEVMVTPPVINDLREGASAVKVTAVQDQRKLVDCVARGTPTPRIMWVLPGNVILPAPYYSNRITVHENGTLEIRSPKRSDSGQLACIARNEGGEVRLVVNLDVKQAVERPQVRGLATDSLSLTVGNSMILNCSVEGSALSHVTWILPNGTPLLSGARLFKFLHRPDGSLIITNPSVGEAGLYRCLGRNSEGLMEHAVMLSPGRKPKINNRYNSPVSIMNGEALMLHCLTSGEPLRLTWTLPSGVVLNRPQRAGRYAVLHNGTLSIQQTSVYDRGSYICRAANGYGSSVLSASVTVIGHPPRITSAPPPVTYAKHGVAIQLNCAATGIPKAEVAWETPDKTRLVVSAQPRLFGNKYLHPQGSLVIQNPTQRDAGIYRCTARNAIGIDSKATFLNVF